MGTTAQSISTSHAPTDSGVTNKIVITSPYLTPAEAAIYLKTSPRTLRRWTRSRVVPHIKIRRKLLYKIADLDAAMAKFKIDGDGF